MASVEVRLSGTEYDSSPREQQSNVVSNQEWSKPQTQGGGWKVIYGRIIPSSTRRDVKYADRREMAWTDVNP
jgi:hypothetical protein